MKEKLEFRRESHPITGGKIVQKSTGGKAMSKAVGVPNEV